MKSDFHDGPFSESTRVKLSLFERYISKWLPVFLHLKPQPSAINVVDFFAGPGEDVEHTPGSPQLILRQMRVFKRQMGVWAGKINVILNDADQQKTEKLEALLADRFADVQEYVNVRVLSEEFHDLYEGLKGVLSAPGAASLLFVDQTGLRELPAETFQSILELPTTDLIFFVSSSIARRFHHVEGVRRLVPIPEEIVHATEHYRAHKMVKAYYESLVPEGCKYYLGDFSLQKEKNIYGLIFGSHSLRGLDKFVACCWEVDANTGEANYSLDHEDLDNPTPSLFDLKPRKIEVFEVALTQMIEDRELTTNWQILEYSLRNGMLARHAKQVLRQMQKNGTIEKVVPLAYESVRKATEPIRLRRREAAQ